MERIELGSSGIEVSGWCLGTMTFGSQTPEDEAHRIIDGALGAGINFLDAAEMYPVAPVRAETVGRTEEIIGNWVEASGRRDEVVIATKVTGSGQRAVRDGRGFDGRIVREAVEASLKRLRTDRIDLYQLHWPDRDTYHFRKNWRFDPRGQDRAETLAHMDDVLGALADLVAEGKIRAFGLSNETAWGTVRWIDRAEALGGPRVVSVQNEYSLLCRHYDTDLAEAAVNEGVVLLAFSPLAAGLLTGKYAGGAVPEDSRAARVPDLGGRMSARVHGAVAAYHAVAEAAGLDPVQMALAWLRTRPFPVVPIFGARTVGQLERILGGIELRLPEDVVAEIEKTHRAHPMPY